jgi:hypothetical protein
MRFVNALAIDPSTPARLYAGTDAGVFEYQNAAAGEPGATTLCLNGRFRVTAAWSGLVSGAGQAIPMTNDTGAFQFSWPGNEEVVVSVLNRCDVNSHYWVYVEWLASSNASVLLTVTDTQTGAVKTYTTSPFPPILDTNHSRPVPDHEVLAGVRMARS